MSQQVQKLIPKISVATSVAEIKKVVKDLKTGIIVGVDEVTAMKWLRRGYVSWHRRLMIYVRTE